MYISGSINTFMRTGYLIELIKTLNLWDYSEIKENSRKYFKSFLPNINYVVYLSYFQKLVIDFHVLLINIQLIYKLLGLILSLITVSFPHILLQYSTHWTFSMKVSWIAWILSLLFLWNLSYMNWISKWVEEFSSVREVAITKVKKKNCFWKFFLRLFNFQMWLILIKV